MTIAEAAKRLEISRSLAYRLVEEKRLPCHRIGANGRRGKIIVTDEDLKAFLESVKAKAT